MLVETGATEDGLSMESGGSLSGNRLMLVLLFLVSLVSVVAVIVAAVSLTNSDSDTPSINVNSQPGVSGSGGSGSPIIINSGSGGSGSPNSGSSDRIFKIAVHHTSSRGHSYLDERGYVTGFIPDLINAVCEAGGMNCVTIWDDPSSCWVTEEGQHGRGGLGLLNGWFDACPLKNPTVERVQVFDFSLPFYKDPPTFRFVIMKSNNDFHGDDLTGKKIGFIDTRPADAKCLARQGGIKGNILPEENIKHYDTEQNAFAGLSAGEVDAVLDFPSSEFKDQVKVAEGTPLQCVLGGSAMMTMKDNDFNSYWNRGFQKLRDSGKFRKLCEQANSVDHAHMGGIRTCVDAP